MIERKYQANDEPLPTPLQRVLRSAQARRYLKEVLGAVVTPGGTAQRLAAWKSWGQPGLGFHIAKTGTTNSPSGATRDVYLTGGLVFDGALYSYFIMAGAADPRRPLGNRFHGGHLSPLARLLLQEPTASGNRIFASKKNVPDQVAN